MKIIVLCILQQFVPNCCGRKKKKAIFCSQEYIQDISTEVFEREKKGTDERYSAFQLTRIIQGTE